MDDTYLLALHSIDGLGPIRLKAILDYFKDAKLSWEARGDELINLGIPKNVVSILIETRRQLNPLEYANSIRNSGIKWLTIFDENYPKSLKEIYDPPVVLYYKGEILSSDENAIGIVGTRKITGYGKVVTEQFTKDLVLAGLTIISGLARGVDSVAHKTAIEQKGRTLAVLGGGLNNIFPFENINLATQISSGFGAIISEFPPDHPSMPGNFPARNRIISGLSKAVLVTEAASDSGSLITARVAVEQGKDVFAIPGPITSLLSEGPLDLIKTGAKAVSRPQEILDELGIKKGVRVKPEEEGEIELSEEEKKIMELLGNETMHLDEIGRIIKYPSSKVSALLLRMEISGKIISLGSGNYCKG